MRRTPTLHLRCSSAHCAENAGDSRIEVEIKSAPAAWLPMLATNIWSSYNMADINDKEQSEFDQDLDDVEEVLEAGKETIIKAHYLAVQMMQNPQILTAFQERLDIEAKFYEEAHDLEIKYVVLYQPLSDK
ncbi:hypothetical protein GH733_014389 [Mirounga leonina]|nr:hypothetical protein GH733_014389 [Mirounga leonina]